MWSHVTLSRKSLESTILPSHAGLDLKSNGHVLLHAARAVMSYHDTDLAEFKDATLFDNVLVPSMHCTVS